MTVVRWIVIGLLAMLLLLVAAYGFASRGPSSFEAHFRTQATDALAIASAPSGAISDAEVDALPAPVADYVRRSGAVGQPHVRSFYAEIHGRIRGGPDEAWMPYTVRQLNTYGPHPQRFFLMNATRSGLPVRVFHAYDEHATMRGRLLDVVPVVQAAGDQMDRSETVTLLNDLVLFAPGALVDAPIRWTNVTGTTVDATYTRGDQTITAQLVFDNGDLVDFVSDDRMRASGDGSTFTPQRWSTPVSGYAVFGDRRVAAQGLGRWSAPAPEGQFTYIELAVDDIAYNVNPDRVRRP